MGSVWVCAHKFAKTQTVPDKTCGVILWVKKAFFKKRKNVSGPNKI